MEINFKDGQEYFGMAGPWLADCYLNDKKLKNKFLIDNFAISADNKFLGLSQYIESKNNSREFKIILIDLLTERIFESKTSYKALFIDKISSDRINFYNAFHNQIETYRQSIHFSADNFSEIKWVDAYS